MKKIFFITTAVLCLYSCNMNPSKEARIQKLETDLQQTIEKINQLEGKVQTLELENEQLKTRLFELEK